MPPFNPEPLVLSSAVEKRNKSIILPPDLYACENWFLTLRVFENRVLGRIFRLKAD
jgi:hypothetical protein